MRSTPTEKFRRNETLLRVQVEALLAGHAELTIRHQEDPWWCCIIQRPGDSPREEIRVLLNQTDEIQVEVGDSITSFFGSRTFQDDVDRALAMLRKLLAGEMRVREVKAGKQWVIEERTAGQDWRRFSVTRRSLMPLVAGVGIVAAIVTAFVIGARAVPGVLGILLGMALVGIVIVVTRMALNVIARLVSR